MTSFTQIPAKNKQGYKWICVKDGPPDPVTGKRNQIKRRADTKKAAESRVDDIIKKLKEHGIDRKKVKNYRSAKLQRIGSNRIIRKRE